MSQKIIVTGGAGFIGSHTVVELINAGFEPIIIDNFSASEKFIPRRIEKITGKKIKLYEADCRDRQFISEIFNIEKPTGVIHFAAFKSVGESVSNPEKYYDNNINSLLVMLEVMKENKVLNLVFSSSCTVYGEPQVIPVNEKTPLQKASSPYAETKVICEEKLLAFQKENQEFRIAILRYFNPIGAHPSGEIGELPLGIPTNLVPFLTQTAAGWREKLIINGNNYNTSDGTCVRDYIHVVDLAIAHIASLNWLSKQKNNFSPEIFNLGTGNGNTIIEAIHAFESLNKMKLPYEFGPIRAGDVEKIYASVKKAHDILNWKCNFTLEDSMEHAWKWQQTLTKPN